MNIVKKICLRRSRLRGLFKMTYVKLIWLHDLSKNFLRTAVLMKKSARSMEKTRYCSFNITFSTALNSCQHLPPFVRAREKNTRDLQDDVKKTCAASHLCNFCIRYYAPRNGVPLLSVFLSAHYYLSLLIWLLIV